MAEHSKTAYLLSQWGGKALVREEILSVEEKQLDVFTKEQADPFKVEAKYFSSPSNIWMIRRFMEGMAWLWKSQMNPKLNF